MTTGQMLYFKMLRIRRIEERIAQRYPEQKMRCPVHLSIGQEAAAVGVCSALNKNDLVVSTHRGHAHYLAKGGSLKGLICELYGKVSGCSRGQGGSMHLVDWAAGFAGSTSVVGGTIPIGVGLAFAKKLKKEPGVVVVAIGDAALEQGVFHEAANFASLHKLPVLFLVENNLYSCYTHLDQRQPKRALTNVAAAHSMKALMMGGNDCWRIYNKTKELLEHMRNRPAPIFLELMTYRHLEHCGPNNDDHLKYRKDSETKTWMKSDPLLISEADLVIRKEYGPREILEWDLQITEEIDEAFEFAEASPFPDISELGGFQYASN